MRIMFCNISYMKNYIGITKEDRPVGAGKWVKENNDAHEKWNFLNINGRCYGFVQLTGSEFHIERLDGVSRKADMADDVLVVWCSPREDGAVIVGWYHNAKVYRHYKSMHGTLYTGLDRDFFCEANADDCVLLPEEKREFFIRRASRAGSGKGFGQSNVWYADSEYAKEIIVPDVLNYIEHYDGKRINRQEQCFRDSGADAGLSETESNLLEKYDYGDDIYPLLSLAYRGYNAEPNPDNAYIVADILKGLHQYDKAIVWFEKVATLEGYKWDTASTLAYLYYQVMDGDNLNRIVTMMDRFEEMRNDDNKANFLNLMVWYYWLKCDLEQAMIWLEKIIELPGIDKVYRSDCKLWWKEMADACLMQ